MMKKFMWIRLGCLLTLLCVGSIAECKQRALWVTRWDFKNEADVVQIFENAKKIGTEQVLFQIRGNATVLYPSQIEPWAWELTSNDARSTGRDPGWDPLRVAVREAKKHDMEIHGWINVFPGWRGVENPPPALAHPWATKRAWFMVDHSGAIMQSSKTFYTFLSPGNPEVRAYTAAVFAELARQYPDMDGLHMDYVRYPGNKELGTYRCYSFDKASVDAFKKMYGKNPTPESPEWPEFKCNQITQSIREIREAMRKVHPTMQLSATFVAERKKAHTETGQDALKWLAEDLVDWAVPMAYQRNSPSLQKSLNELEAEFFVYKNKMIIGLNVDFNNHAEVSRQIQMVFDQGWGGEALFAYSSLFPGHKGNPKATLVQKVWQEDKLRELLSKGVTSAN